MKSAWIVVAALVGMMASVAECGDPPSPFKINAKKKDDVVTVHVEKDKAVFSIKSPSGISQAVIERKADNWSKTVVLRLHLTGLESFGVTNGKVTCDAAVSSQDSKVRIWKDGEEKAPLDPKSPFWMQICLVGSDGKPAKSIPLKDGYFEMQLPKAFFEENPKSITLDWIDFYRN